MEKTEKKKATLVEQLFAFEKNLSTSSSKKKKKNISTPESSTPSASATSST